MRHDTRGAGRSVAAYQSGALAFVVETRRV